FPVSGQILHHPVGAVLEPRGIIEQTERKALAAIESRGGLFIAKVEEVLSATWSEKRTRDFSRTVIDEMAPGIRGLILEALGEPLFEVHRQGVVVGIALRGKRSDGCREARVSVERSLIAHRAELAE